MMGQPVRVSTLVELLLLSLGTQEVVVSKELEPFLGTDLEGGAIVEGIFKGSGRFNCLGRAIVGGAEGNRSLSIKGDWSSLG